MSYRVVLCLLACLTTLSACRRPCRFPEFAVAPCPEGRDCVWPGCSPDTACQWYGRWSGVQCEGRPDCLTDLVDDVRSESVPVLNAGEMGCAFFEGCGLGYPPFLAVLLLPEDIPRAKQLSLSIADGCCGGHWVSSGGSWVPECKVPVDGGLFTDAGPGDGGA